MVARRGTAAPVQMMAHPPRTSAIDAGATIDRGVCGGYQILLVFLTALTIIFDGVDNQLLGIVIPSVMRDWGVARSTFAPVVALGFLGMMVGGLVAGLAGDRFGRKVALFGSMVLFGAATVLMTAVNGIAALAALRLIAGIGLGGAMPNAAALVAEYVPIQQRALAVTMTIVCVPLGGTLAGLLAIPALPAVGWRGLFVIGGVIPLVASVILWRLIPESPRFLARRPERWRELRRVLWRMGHAVDEATEFVAATVDERRRVPFSALFARALRTDTLALWTAFFSCLLCVYLGFSWLPAVLTGAGLGPSVANTSITLFNLGGVAGAIFGGLSIRRLGSRATMLTMAAAGIAGLIVLSRTAIDGDSVVRILVLLTFCGAMINAVQTTMYALAAHVYPTEIRATGVGTAVSIGRSGAILSGYAGPWALEFRGSASFFAVMAIALSVAFIALAVVRRHVTLQSVRTQ
jgi:AAHS family 4-hydroxybenzoate transporter-like MFS transporter